MAWPADGPANGPPRAMCVARRARTMPANPWQQTRNMRSKVVTVAILVLGPCLQAAPLGFAGEPLPRRLHETGLYLDGTTSEIRPGLLPFSPQYPLWSDGAAKRRWIGLPPARAIDASDPATWNFPPGTRFWKEFSLGGRPVETRMIERLAGGDWRFATYVWNEPGTDATLAPEQGIPALPLPGGGDYAVPSVADCLACHEGAPVPVLGFSALQLSSDRDPLAPHAEPPRHGDVDLRDLAEQGRLHGLPQALLDVQPRIQARTPAGRAALGYLHANCGHCHVDAAASAAGVPVPLTLWLDPADPAAAARVQQELVHGAGRYRPPGGGGSSYVVPGDSAAGTLLLRLRSRDPRSQMPPLGSRIPDELALALIGRWVEQDLVGLEEASP